MLRSALVALDGSLYTEAVTALALDSASRSGARLVGLGVLDEPSIHGRRQDGVRPSLLAIPRGERHGK